MKIEDLDVLTRNAIADQYRREGLIVIPQVQLPDTFAPQESDIVFLKVHGACEVYIASGVDYQGADTAWRRISRQAPSAGGTRRVLVARGDLFTALSQLRILLAQAGGNYQSNQTQAVVPQVDGVQPTVQTAPALQPQSDDMDRPLPENGRPTAPSPNRQSRGSTSPLRNLVDECRRNPRHHSGRESLLKALKTNLLRESKRGIVLLGKEGVGKTALVEMLAQDIAFGRNIPTALVNVPIFDLPLGALVENSRYVGDIERHVRRLVDVTGEPIFFLDEVHQLSRPELKPLSDLLKPALASRRMRMIGATTFMEWRKIEDNAFKRRFLELVVEEPTPAETYLMLRERVKSIAEHHHLDIDDAVIKEAVMLSARYLPARQFPDKAIDVLDLAAALQVVHSQDTVSATSSGTVSGPKTEANQETTESQP